MIPLSTVRQYTLKYHSLDNPLNYFCPYCHAHLFIEERMAKFSCCNNGSQVIPAHPCVPESLLLSVYDNTHFRKHMSYYNNLFCLAAFGSISNTLSTGAWVQTHQSGIMQVVLSGKPYYRIFNPSLDASNSAFSFRNNSRCYLLESDRLDTSVIQYSILHTPGVVAALRQFLYATNRWIREFTNVLSSIDSNVALRNQANLSVEFRIDTPAGVTNSNAEQISLLIFSPNREGQLSTIACLVLPVTPFGMHNQTPLYVTADSSFIEPLLFPILFPRGTRGWGTHKQSNKNHSSNTLYDVSGQQVVSYYHYVRQQLLTNLLFQKATKLAHEWICIMKARHDDIQYDQMRSALTIIIAKQSKSNGTSSTSSRYALKLPPSDKNHPTTQSKNKENLLAISSRLGRFNIMVTFTANPNWPEITANLLPHQTAADRPDLVARVFKLKFQELLLELTTTRNSKPPVFGRLPATAYAIEWQGRGLPHAHIVLNAPDVNITNIEQYISARIPTTHGALRDLVMQHHIHHRCDLPGIHSCFRESRSGCMCCRFDFPFQFSPFVFFNEVTGRVHYTRSPDSTTLNSYGQVISDAWVSTYSPYLLLRFGAHCNVTYATSDGACIYLCKYISKLTMWRQLSITLGIDEIEALQRCRQIGASEAIWNAFGYDTRNTNPGVVAISVHLPGNLHTLTRNEDTQEENAVTMARALKDGSEVTIYFNRPIGEAFQSMLYIDYFERYQHHPKSTTFAQRQLVITDPLHNFLDRCSKLVTLKTPGRRRVCRIRRITNATDELFHVRLLLLKIPASSFEMLRTVNFIVQPTFKHAAVLRGLYLDSNEYLMAMGDAVQVSDASALRRYCVTLHNQGANLAEIWSNYADKMSTVPFSNQLDHLMALTHIAKLLHKEGIDITKTSLSAIFRQHQITTTKSSSATVILQYNISLLNNQYLQQHVQLNADQLIIFERLRQVIDHKIANPTTILTNVSFLLTSSGGCGKSFLAQCLLNYTKSRGHIALALAPTGIAASSYTNGLTIHSAFKLVVATTAEQKSVEAELGMNDNKLNDNCVEWDLLRAAKLIIIDEILMVNIRILRAIDAILRTIHQCDAIFGGIPFLLMGDPRQLSPVVLYGSHHDSYLESLFHWSMFPKITRLNLSLSMRHRDDPLFADWVLQVGEQRANSIDIVDNNAINTILPSDNTIKRLLLPPTVERCTTLEDANEFLFDEYDFIFPSETTARKCFITYTNDQADIINATLLKSVNTVLQIMTAADSDINYSDSDQAAQLMLPASAFVDLPHRLATRQHLHLKIGALGVITRNINSSAGLRNGVRFRIEHISTFSLKVYLLSGNHKNTYENIPRVTQHCTAGVSGVHFKRTQFPVCLGYAATVNKCQGLTLDKSVINLELDAFQHGALYTTFSRVRQFANVRVYSSINTETPVTPVNVVYRNFLTTSGILI